MNYNNDMADPRDIPNAPDIIKAAYAIDVSAVRDLLAAGADVNSLDERDNLTVLHIACLYNYEKMVDVILAHDAAHHDVDFEALSKFNPRTAWQVACDTGYQELSVKVYDAGVAAASRTSEPSEPRRPVGTGPRVI